VAVVSAGGALGAVARHAIGLAVPHSPTGFPWSTLLVNALGCLLIGVLAVLVVRVWPDRRLVRPFLGVGVLGGFTTFSAFVGDAGRAAMAGVPGTAMAYLALTVSAALGCVWVGETVTARVLDRRGVRAVESVGQGVS